MHTTPGKASVSSSGMPGYKGTEPWLLLFNQQLVKLSGKLCIRNYDRHKGVQDSGTCPQRLYNTSMQGKW